jgi:hypothetical protein
MTKAAKMMENVKFFPKDKKKGKMKKVGDRFTAFFLMGDFKFEVTEVHDGFVMARMVD